MALGLAVTTFQVGVKFSVPITGFGSVAPYALSSDGTALTVEAVRVNREIIGYVLTGLYDAFHQTGSVTVQLRDGSNDANVAVTVQANASTPSLGLASSTFLAGVSSYALIIGVQGGAPVAYASDGTALSTRLLRLGWVVSGNFQSTGSKTITLVDGNTTAMAGITVASAGGGTPTPTPTQNLLLSNATPSIVANAPAGTLITAVSAVPAGATPTVAPNDGRFVIAGDASLGWKVVKGLTAYSAGTVALTISAPGANSASATLTITPAVSTQFAAFAPTADTVAYTAAMTTAPETRRAKTLNRFIQRLKGSIPGSTDGNVWDALKTLPNAYLYLVGATEDQWLVNVLNPSTKLTKVGSPTFTPNQAVTHSAATDYYDTGVTLAALSGKDVSFGGFSNAAAAVLADSFEMGALDGGSPSSGLSLGFKGSSTSKVGVRALSASLTVPSSVDYWSGEGMTGVSISGTTAYTAHHGKRIDTLTRSGTQTFTSTNTIRILGATGSTVLSNKPISCAYLGGLLTAAQESWLAACVRNTLEDIRFGDVDLFEEKIGPATLAVDVAVIGATLQGVIGANKLKELNPTANIALFGTEFETRVMHVGGMSRGGLTYVDSNAFNATAISGRYRDVQTYINVDIYGGADTTSQAGLGVDPKLYGYACRRMLDPNRTGSASKINGQTVPVYLSRGVQSVSGDVGNYTITMNDGRVVTAKYILGAEFDGKLLKSFVGIKTITGTEGYNAANPNSGDQESYNGYKGTIADYLTYPTNKANGAIARVDPYITPGNPASGFLPLLDTLPNLAINDPDPISQPLNQRHSVANTLGRFVPWPTTAPSGYNSLEWEPNFRFYALQPTVNLLSICNIRNGRSPVFDMNNASPLSTDRPGSGLAYTQAVAADVGTGYANALAVRQNVFQHGKAFFWHVLGSGDSRVPTSLRSALAAYTLDATQYCDPDPNLGEELHWAPMCAVYVRDPVYRMVRSEVLPFSGQDANLADGATVRPNGRTAGVAAYWVDRHTPRRIAYDDGSGISVVGQGEYFVASGGSNLVSPVAYDHIIPDKAACKGMVHALAGNFTAVGWSQVRMEPALSHLTEFGACAITVAMQAGNIAVQDVDYATVKALAQNGSDNSTLALPATA